MSEFGLIRDYFSRLGAKRSEVAVSVGDDAAVVNITNGHQLVVAVDTLVEGVHFPIQTPPDAIGHKSLAVNLSDLAAMGAEPVWALLAVTLPKGDVSWIESFCSGFHRLANRYNVECIGGDTTQGPLTISVTVGGIVPVGEAVLRSGAKPGDAIYVTGTIGDAGLGLAITNNTYKPKSSEYFIGRLNCPEPRISFINQLRRYATSAIDVSDGLIADLGHILDASRVGAALYTEMIPLHPELKQIMGTNWAFPLSSGDDYELCLTVAENDCTAFEQSFSEFNFRITRIGEILPTTDLELIDEKGKQLPMTIKGYNHFS